MKVWLEYEFEAGYKNWPHILKIVGDKEADDKWRTYWGDFNYDFYRLIRANFFWKDGDSLDLNAGIYGFRTLAHAVHAKFLWGQVKLPQDE